MSNGAANGHGTANGNGHAAGAPEHPEIIAWTESLPIATITTWGGMISTPDEFLEDLLWKTLNDDQCPLSIVEQMIHNCHEKRWPPGLNTLETRQASRNHYKNYVCRQLRSYHKAVVIMHYENKHMPANMILEPGIVMAFAYGIEDDGE